MLWKERDWERWIHCLAADSSSVRWSSHARFRMYQRGVTAALVLDVLRNGIIVRRPETNIRTGYIECRVQRRCAGRHLAVVVALACERAPSCLVVTVFDVGV